MARMLVYAAGYSLFLTRYTAAELPLVYVAAAAVAAVSSAVYLRASARLSFRALLVVATLGQALAAFAARMAIGADVRAAFVLPLLYELFLVAHNVAFWTLAGRVFDFEQSKRLFGLLNAGERVSDLVAGASIPALVHLLGNDGLISLAGVVMALAVLPLLRISRRLRHERDDGVVPPLSTASLDPIRAVPMVRFVLGQVCLATICFQVVDLLFFKGVEQSRSQADDATTFLGVFFAYVALACLLGQMFVTRRWLRRLDVRGALLVMPLGIVVSVFVVLASDQAMSSPAAYFTGIVVVRFAASTLSAVLHEPAVALGYQPLPVGLRIWLHGVADGVVAPLALAIAGLGLAALQAAKITTAGLGTIAFLLGLVWIGNNVALGRRHRIAQAEALRRLDG